MSKIRECKARLVYDCTAFWVDPDTVEEQYCELSTHKILRDEKDDTLYIIHESHSKDEWYQPMHDWVHWQEGN